MNSTSERYWSYVDKSGPVHPTLGSRCWLWTLRLNEWGYGKFGVAGSHIPAHRVAWENAHGRIPDGLWVLHRCDVPACVNPDHLFLGTHADNMRDKAAKGRAPSIRGSRNGNAKLSDADVAEIRLLLAAKIPHAEIAPSYDVSTALIGHIAIGRLRRVAAT